MIETFKGVMPFFLAEFVRVAPVCCSRRITLWLPRVLGG